MKDMIIAVVRQFLTIAIQSLDRVLTYNYPYFKKSVFGKFARQSIITLLCYAQVMYKRVLLCSCSIVFSVKVFMLCSVLYKCFLLC